MMEEDDSQSRSLRPLSVAGGVNPLRRRGSAIGSISKPLQPPPPVPTSAPPKPPPPPPPPPPAPPALAIEKHLPEKDEDQFRQSVALSFSGLYPNRLSEVETDGASPTLPTIDEDEFMDIEHPLADTTFAIPEPPESAPPARPPPPALPSQPPAFPINKVQSIESLPPPSTAAPPAPSSSPMMQTVFESRQQQQPPSEPPVEYEKIGIGWKQCPSVALLWQVRFFVLKKDGSIHYYSDRNAYVEKYAPKGVINLVDLQNNPTSRNGIYDSVELMHDKLNIHVRSKGNRVYKLKFGTAEEAKAWRDAICNHIKKLNP